MELSSLAARTDLTAPPPSGRERVIQAAYQLFTLRGTRAVGIDTVIAAARVAKMTLYRNFVSKDELILAVLERREHLWTRQWLESETRRRAPSPVGQLLAIFQIFNEWFQRADFEGCLFIRTMLEISDRSDPVRQASMTHLDNVRGLVRELAEVAGIADPDTFSRQWHILMTGSILAAEQGDRQAAERARELGILVLHQHGRTPKTREAIDGRAARERSPRGRGNGWTATA